MMLNEVLARFTTIGENLHTTRVVLRKGSRVATLEDGVEGVRFRDPKGQTRYLTVPPSFHDSAAYQEGQIKHVLIAVQKGLSEDSDAAEEGAAYVRYEAQRQVDAGASYLDLNVDEFSTVPNLQQAAMRWLVSTVQATSPIPLSIDSSTTAVLRAGLEACDRRAGRPLLNSASLERLDALGLAREYDAAVVVTAAGEGHIPGDVSERVANVARLMEHTTGMSLSRLYVDPLVLPISVDIRHGCHYLDAVRALRKTYGPDIHITGGLSNVSFGLPQRKLINQTFIDLAIEAGVDSAIMDPVQSRLADVVALDRQGRPYQQARALLLGEDEDCVAFLRAWRAGSLGGEASVRAEKGNVAT